jgi:hypothetical protein
MAYRLRSALFLAIALSTGSTVASAQSASSVRGTITEQSGSVVPGASVVLSNPQTSFSRTTHSASDGVYQFVDVPPGTYTVTVDAPGFEESQLNHLQLLVNTPATADIAVHIGAQVNTVTVSAQAQTLNTEDATAGNAFESQQIQQLPIESRNVVDLLSLQPGVSYLGNRTDINLSEDTRSGAVNGARSDQTIVTLDGVDATDQANGYAFTSVLRTTPDALEEFRVTTSNPTAADGNSSGAQVALLTKSGGNAFHGAFYEYLRNTATSANDYFVKQSQVDSGLPNKALQLNRNLFGVAAGGPIKKDRLFFFANYEGRRDAQKESVVTTVPTASLRAGNVTYDNANGGVSVVTPQTLQSWDPLGVGPNAPLQQYFNTFPAPNDLSVGDGVNFSGYRFGGAAPARYDVYIARFDYKLDAKGNHTLFARGSMQNDYVDSAPYLPGLPAETVQEDRSKGFAIGYTAAFKPTLVNDLRFGLTRASVGNSGDSQAPFLGINSITGGITRGNSVTLPVYDINDGASWTKGPHTIQFGGNAEYIRDNTVSEANSFSQASLSTTYIDTGGFAGTGSPFDPGAHAGVAAVSPNFTYSYDQAAFDDLGIITDVTANYNYTKSGSVQNQGTPVKRNYSMTQYDFYLQDSFRVKSNLTINFGLRYQLESPPTEINGLQVSSTMSLGQWAALREANMAKGIPSNQDPTIQYVLGGSKNNGPAFYNWSYKNIAPRLSIAYSPTPKTSIRSGFAMAYDHFGAELINSFGQYGSFGLSTTLQTPLGSQDVSCAPRVTSLTAIPTNGCPNVNNGKIMLPAPPGGFPQTPPVGFAAGGFSDGFSLDQNLKTPYVYMLNFSVARELSSTSSLEVTYLGRLGHRLASINDFAQPMNLRDPKSGFDYFTAMSRLSTMARQGVPLSQISAATVGPSSAYWEDLFQPITQAAPTSACPAGSCTATQAIYSMEQIYLYNETFIPYFTDIPGFICPNGCDSLGPYTYYDPQFFSLNGWQSVGGSNYNALQVTFRKRPAQGISFDLNYSLSHSLDLTSAAARVNPTGGLAPANIINAFSPSQMYATSDFDMTHQFNANWVAELPVGHGKRFAGDAPGWVNAAIGGWQFSGIYRLTSGLPFSVSNGVNLPTNGANAGYATQTGPIQAGKATKASDGRVLLFKNPTNAFNAYQFTYPGQSGSRNTVRGDGFLGWDSALSKRWTMPYNDGHSLQFRAEAFNVGNFTRFDVNSNQPSLTNSSNFGTYTGLLTNPRVMQFALRYEF